MKHGHLTEQRKQFVEAYCRLGNGTLAAKEAGYKDLPSLVNQASKLKRELSSEIAEEDISTQGYAEEWNSHSFADLPGMDFLSYSQSSDHMMSVQTAGGLARENDAPTPRQAVEIISSSDEEQSSMITPQQKMKRRRTTVDVSDI